MKTKGLLQHWNDAEQHLIRVEPKFERLIQMYGPCTLSPKTDYFRVLCGSIISQQLSTKAANTIYQRFSTLFPEAIVTPEIVLSLDVEQLKQIGCSTAKSTYIKNLAEKTIEGLFDFMEKKDVSSEDIIQELIKVKGIGRWTAEMFLIFALNKPDVLPVDDLGVKKALQVFWGLESMPDKTMMNAKTRKWTPFRSIASWYLWRSLENKS